MLLKIGPDPFISQSSPKHSHRPELIFHIMKSKDQTSVLLSVVLLAIYAISFTLPPLRRLIDDIRHGKTRENIGG